MDNRMFSPAALAGSKGVAAHVENADEAWQLMPVPPDAPALPPLNGSAPCTPYAYGDAEGRTLGYVVRFDKADGRKDFQQWTYGVGTDGREGWRAKAFPVSRPLYGLHRLAQRPSDPVLVVEGEKTADAAALLLPRYVVVTSPGGARAANKADWGPLKGRKVVIWPDHDEDGRRYAADVARGAQEAGAITISVVEVPASFQVKWDLADALPEGWTADRIAGLLQVATTVSVPFGQVDAADGVCAPFRLTASAVEHREKDEDGKERPTLVCSRLEILAETRDENGAEWGRVLRVVNGDGTAHDWVMPMTMLAGDGHVPRAAIQHGARPRSGSKE